MTSMREMLAGCLADDPKAWGRLWAIVAPSIRRPSSRRLMEGLGDGSLIEDAEQDFFLFLSEDACRRLRSFRGDDEPAFRAYIAAVARNFLLSYRASRRRAAAREDRSMPAVARCESDGPSEPQLVSAFQEFLAILTVVESRRLGRLLFSSKGGDAQARASEIAPRTLRRWHRDLATIYRDRFL